MDEATKRSERIRAIRNAVAVNDANLAKIPPNNIELEEAILGAIFLEPITYRRISDQLKPETFYKESHNLIYKAMQRLAAKGEPIDLLTVKHELTKAGELENVGGPLYLSSLPNKVNSSVNIETHARIVQEHYMARRLIVSGNEITKKAFEADVDVFDLLSEASISIGSILTENVKADVTVARDLMNPMLKDIEDRLNNKVSGLQSSIVSIRNKIGYFANGDMIVVGGSTSMGKTAYLVSEALYWAREGRAVAIFSLEMMKVQMMYRFISQVSRVGLETVGKGKPNEKELKDIHVAIGQLENTKLFIDDTPGISVQELRAKCHKLNDRHNLEAVFIDYLQLMTLAGKPKNMSREQELSEISRSVKRLAKELNCPVFALVQLSREVGKRKENGYRPILSDIRESGSIEQDADIVMFPYRPHYYGLGDYTEDYAESIIAKNRNGSLGICKMKFTGYVASYTTFTDNEAVKSFAESKNDYDTIELPLGIETKTQEDAPF